MDARVMTIAGSVCVLSVAVGTWAIAASAQDLPGAALDALDPTFVVEPISAIECGNGSEAVCSQRFTVSHPEGVDVRAALREVGATTGVDVVSPTRFETAQSTVRDSGRVLTAYAVVLVCLVIAVMSVAIIVLESLKRCRGEKRPHRR